MKTRSHTKELLDQDEIPREDLFLNLKELHTINKHLGGYLTTRTGLQYFLRKKIDRPISILDIGSGGGDTLKFIFEKKHKAIGKLVGVDIKQDCIDYSQENCNTLPIQFVLSDYRNIIDNPEFDSFDLITTSLFCHHLSDSEIIAMLKWMKQNATLGVFINDLHRHPLAFLSIKYLTALFSKSYLVKNDAPLSVLRSFRRKDWKRYLEAAGITKYKIKWIWAFRWLIILDNT